MNNKDGCCNDLASSSHDNNCGASSGYDVEPEDEGCTAEFV